MSDSAPPESDEPRRDSRVGTMFADRYRINRLVDTGAMGRVYVAEHVLMRKRVAIKVLHRELSLVPEFVGRFEREAMAAANIDNEHVVAATDFGKLADGAVFLVLEYVEGVNLRDEITRGPLQVERALGIARQIGYALKSAHALGIVHRDLKPENVMLVNKAGDPDFVKVLDFGIAKVPIGERRSLPPSGKVITKAGMVFGTPEYMPPEQALGQPVDHRADLYSLGVILYEMLTGVRPFVAETEVSLLGMQLASAAPPVSKRAPQLGIHAGVEKFVARLLEREAAARIQSAQEVLAEIDRLLGQAEPRGERLITLQEGTPPSRDYSRASTEPAPSDPPLELPMSGPLESVSRWLDDRRQSLPAPLKALPPQVVVAVPVAVIGLLLGIALVTALATNDQAASPAPSVGAASAVLGAGETDPADPAGKTEAEPPKASPEELREATERGLPALELLGKKYEKDAAIPIAISAEHLKRRDFKSAVDAIAEALTLDPELRRDKQVASVLWVAAQNRASADAAFALLEGPMNERGREILRDLTTTKAVRADVKKRAQETLARLE